MNDEELLALLSHLEEAHDLLAKTEGDKKPAALRTAATKLTEALLEVGDEYNARELDDVAGIDLADDTDTTSDSE